jgi:hypothetical protein
LKYGLPCDHNKLNLLLLEPLELALQQERLELEQQERLQLEPLLLWLLWLLQEQQVQQLQVP